MAPLGQTTRYGGKPMMRQTDRTRMGLALAGLLFCLTSAASTMTHRNTSQQGSAQSAMDNHSHPPIRGASVKPVPLSQNPIPIWRERLKGDSTMRLLTLWPASKVLEINRDVAPNRWQSLVSHLTSATSARVNNSPTQYVAMFYRRDGSLDWLLDVKPDGTLYDPLHHRYLHAKGWWAPNQAFASGGPR